MAAVLGRTSVTAVIVSVLEAVLDQRTPTALYVFSIPLTSVCFTVHGNSRVKIPLSTNCVSVYLAVIVKYKVGFQSLSPLAILHISILIFFSLQFI